MYTSTETVTGVMTKTGLIGSEVTNKIKLTKHTHTDLSGLTDQKLYAN